MLVVLVVVVVVFAAAAAAAVISCTCTCYAYHVYVCMCAWCFKPSLCDASLPDCPRLPQQPDVAPHKYLLAAAVGTRTFYERVIRDSVDGLTEQLALLDAVGIGGLTMPAVINTARRTMHSSRLSGAISNPRCSHHAMVRGALQTLSLFFLTLSFSCRRHSCRRHL